MQDTQFDQLSKTLAQATSRRQALKLFAASGVGGAFALFGAEGAGAVGRCKQGGYKCRQNSECCSGFCDPSTSACACPAGQVECANGRCLSCSGARFANAATCTCDCAVGTTPCGTSACCPSGTPCCDAGTFEQCCAAPNTCSACPGTPGVSLCCPPGTQCRLTPVGSFTCSF
jgi:hypothetical protein